MADNKSMFKKAKEKGPRIKGIDEEDDAANEAKMEEEPLEDIPEQKDTGHVWGQKGNDVGMLPGESMSDYWVRTEEYPEGEERDKAKFKTVLQRGKAKSREKDINELRKKFKEALKDK